jgi:DNA-binding NarL/FixJ family response regulator
MTRILVVDDHEVVRRGLVQMIGEDLPGADFAGAGTGPAALELLTAGPFDLLLLDINLPGRDGLDVLGEVRRRWPGLPVLIISAYPEEEFAVRCLRAGASGYVTKDSLADELLAATHKALAGGRYVSRSLAERLASLLAEPRPDDPRERLSDRELQVLRLVAVGRSAKEIAAELSLSEKTVGTYRARISDKLGLSTNVELTRYALKHKLVD